MSLLDQSLSRNACGICVGNVSEYYWNSHSHFVVALMLRSTLRVYMDRELVSTVHASLNSCCLLVQIESNFVSYNFFTFDFMKQLKTAEWGRVHGAD